MDFELSLEDDDDTPPIKCPRCGYLRKPDDDERAPRWQCPRCGVSYEKAGVSPDQLYDRD
ncbi:MAG: hypothetical protein KDG50_09370 [Chromatiales bacterium]|nr:hypothetical protein [Chromatiales bacterium]